jgi:N-acetylglucosaminyldiphosphoundecaprenol N-acetyl-beta-D-mannosaminyltransferase
MRNRALRESVPTCLLGGMRIAAISQADTAELMRRLVTGETSAEHPVYMTSANGQVLSEYARRPALRPLFDADLVSADGQPMVLLSRLMSRTPVPDRAATTDLYHEVSKRLPPGSRYFLLGASPPEVERAVRATERLYPHIEIVGYSHGYVKDEEEDALVARINEAAPDVLWLSMGVPREQAFAVANRDRLTGVKIIKTSGGLFNFLSGLRPRAPKFVQAAGFEWAWRLALEPRRLFRRYVLSNAHSLVLLLTKTR